MKDLISEGREILEKFLNKQLNEGATILNPRRYREGQKFVYNGGFKELDKAGYRKGDIFTIVRLKNQVDFSTTAKGYRPEDQKYLRTLEAPNGKKYTFSGDLVSYRQFFDQAPGIWDQPQP